MSDYLEGVCAGVCFAMLAAQQLGADSVGLAGFRLAAAVGVIWLMVRRIRRAQ